MKICDIKIERSLSLTGSEWDSLVMSCNMALSCCDILTRKFPVRYAQLQADIAACYTILLKAVLGDEVFTSET